MDTIENLKAKFDRDVARVTAEKALADLAPVFPKSVQLTSGTLPHWISYERVNLWEALALMRKFEPVEFREYKGHYTRFTHSSLNVGKDAGEERSGPYVAEIDVSQGSGYGPTVTFSFFAVVGDSVCKIKVELRPAGYGPAQWGQYAAPFQRSERGRSRRQEGQRLINGEFVANGNLSGSLDKYTKWATGSDDNAHFTYYIMADAEADTAAGPVDWLDAGLRLENLARTMHGEHEPEKLVVSRQSSVKRENGTGELLEMADGSRWFHPYSGGAPYCERKAQEPGK